MSLENGTQELKEVIDGRYSPKENNSSPMDSKIGLDGGWGWCVVFASFLISMIGDGICFSFGLLYTEFLNEFGESKSVTSWIGSLFMAVPLLTGPIMSALVDRYGCKSMTVLGGFISGMGFVLSSFAESITVLFLTFGILAGLGLGLCYVTIVVGVAHWFHKKRNFAFGLAACGTGVGTFVYAPMTEYFIQVYGWRGTTLLLAGTFFNICVCGLLLRKPDWMEQKNRNKKRKPSGDSAISLSTLKDSVSNLEEIEAMLPNKLNKESKLRNSSPSIERLSNMHMSGSSLNLPTFVRANEEIPLEVFKNFSFDIKSHKVNHEDELISPKCSDSSSGTSIKRNQSEDSSQSKSRDLNDSEWEQRSEICDVEIFLPDTNGVAKQNQASGHNVEPHDHLQNVRLHKNAEMYKDTMINIYNNRMRAISCPNIYRNSKTLKRNEEQKLCKEFLCFVKKSMSCSMFLELHFIFLSLSTILLFIWFIVPYFYLVDLMIQYNYTKTDASLIISIVGVTNTIGMIVLGWLGDRTWIHVTKMYGIFLILCGISCIGFYVFLNSFYLLAISAALFGLFFASSFSYMPMILVELVDMDRFTTAYGLNLLCQGIGNLVGPPLAGLLFDLFQSWAQSFIQAGIWIIVSGLLILFIPYTNNKIIFTRN